MLKYLVKEGRPVDFTIQQQYAMKNKLSQDANWLKVYVLNMFGFKRINFKDWIEANKISHIRSQ